MFRNGVYSRAMKNALLLFLIICSVLLYSCKEEKVISLAGDQPVSAPDFITFFQPLSQPYTLADSTVRKKQSDSLRISESVLSALVPDSVWKTSAGKMGKPIFHALGKIQVPSAETYVLVRVQTKTKKWVLVLAFDKEYH